MAEVTNELIFEVLKNLQQRTTNVETVGQEHSLAMNAMRGHLMSIQTDTNNIYGILSRIDQRLDRIEKRLELRELAESRNPYRPE